MTREEELKSMMRGAAVTYEHVSLRREGMNPLLKRKRRVYDVVSYAKLTNSQNLVSAEDDVNLVVVRMLFMCAVLMKPIYEVQSILRDGRHDTLRKHHDGRLQMYMDRAESGQNILLQEGKEYTLDMKEKAVSLCSKQLNSFSNAVEKVVKKLGIEEYQLVAKCVVAQRLITSTRSLFREEVDRLKVRVPRLDMSSVRTMVFNPLEMIYISMSNIVDECDPKEREGQRSASVDKTVLSLFKQMVDVRNILKAVKYAEDENKD